MHSQQGVEMYKQAIQDAQAQGGKVEFGGKVSGGHVSGNYVIRFRLFFAATTKLFAVVAGRRARRKLRRADHHYRSTA